VARKKRRGLIYYESTPLRLESLVIGLHFLIGFIMGLAEAAAMAAAWEAVLLLLVAAVVVVARTP
jgi:hypothetical protein